MSISAASEPGRRRENDDIYPEANDSSPVAQESPATIEIADRPIGRGHPTYIIAELSANHGGRYDQAERLVHAAAEAGADAVKLQTYTADTLTLDSPHPAFQIGQGTAWDGRRLYDLYAEASMPWEWQPRLARVAEECGIALFSSPFDATAVEFLMSFDVPAFKIASFEIVDVPLLRRVARCGRPVIVSTGMASQDEIQLAVQTLREHGCSQIALLKCTSAYPASPESMNLKTIADLQRRFGCVAGLSDHTLGPESAIASVCLGASIIEKHLTWSREDGGPDAGFSLEPAEFRALVSSVRTTEKAIGAIHYGPTEFDRRNLHFRRSLFVVRPVRRGQRLGPEDIRSVRPSVGLAPRHWDDVIGRVAAVDIAPGTPLAWEMLAPQ